jgi:hypothetical protein
MKGWNTYFIPSHRQKVIWDLGRIQNGFLLPKDQKDEKRLGFNDGGFMNNFLYHKIPHQLYTLINFVQWRNCFLD